MSDLKPTDEQAAIVDAFEFGADLVIEAGAGTGKTSTLRLLAEAVPDQRGVYIAYNRSIADEATRKFPASVVCKTAHGLAFGAVGRQFAHRLSGPRVSAQHTAMVLGLREPVRLGEVILSPHQLARLAMQTVQRFCFSAEDRVQRQHVPAVTGLDKPGQRELDKFLVPVAQRAWDEDLSRPAGTLKFSHDVYLKVWALTHPQLDADFVLLDEAQDSNGCVAGLVNDQQAQRVWVGDRAQSIYRWRGAVDAMEHAPGQRLYLSQSFRFGPQIAAEANKWLSVLDTPLRLRGHEPIGSRVERCPDPDAILCRTNGGAMTEVINALAAGRRVALVGGGAEIRRFAEGAMQLQERYSTDHPDLMAFASWSQARAYVEEEPDGSDLRVLVRLVEQHTARGLIRIVDSLVDERHADLLVSTAHKAKGREWPRVRVGPDFQEPKPAEDGSIELRDEECMLAYVAVTRAQQVLDRDGLAWIDRIALTNALADAVSDVISYAVEHEADDPVAAEVAARARDMAEQEPNPPVCNEGTTQPPTTIGSPAAGDAVHYDGCEWTVDRIEPGDITGMAMARLVDAEGAHCWAAVAQVQVLRREVIGGKEYAYVEAAA